MSRRADRILNCRSARCEFESLIVFSVFCFAFVSSVERYFWGEKVLNDRSDKIFIFKCVNRGKINTETRRNIRRPNILAILRNAGCEIRVYPNQSNETQAR